MADTQTQHTETTTTRTVATPEKRKSTRLSDILSIIGFAILIIIIIWGLVYLVSLSSGWFSSLFYRPAATIQVTAPASVTSGTQMTLSWNYSPSVEGSYALLYQCKNGLQFQAKNTTSATSTLVGIPCGVAYMVATSNNSLTLVPTLTGASSTPETLSVVFIPRQTGTQVQGSAMTTINPAVAVAKPTPVKAKPVATKTYTQTSGTYYNAGPAQLSVRIISEYIDGTGAAVVSFDIANVGGSSSGTYYFSAQLPTAQPYPYVSPTQAPLTAGSHIVDTLRFTGVASGGGVFAVTVIGNGANYGNNTAEVQVSAPYTNYNNNNYNPTPYTVYPTYTY